MPPVLYLELIGPQLPHSHKEKKTPRVFCMTNRHIEKELSHQIGSVEIYVLLLPLLTQALSLPTSHGGILSSRLHYPSFLLPTEPPVASHEQ